MPWRLAVGVYKEYYRPLKFYLDELRVLEENYGEFIISFLAELECSKIPDWAKYHFVDATINYPVDFDANYYSNTSILLEQSDKNQRIKWDNEQEEALLKVCDVMEKAVQRTINKAKGTIYPDEEKYKGFVEEIKKNGGLYSNNLLNENSSNIVKLYTNFVTQGRLYSDEMKASEESLNKNDSIKLSRVLECNNNSNN